MSDRESEPLVIWDDLSDIEVDPEKLDEWMRESDASLERQGLERITRHLANGNTITSIQPKHDA